MISFELSFLLYPYF